MEEDQGEGSTHVSYRRGSKRKHALTVEEEVQLLEQEEKEENCP